MSRIGKLPIEIPSGVAVTIKDDLVTVKGPKGELSQRVKSDIKVSLEDGILKVERPTDAKEHRALHGLYRALIHNMVVGVSEGYKKQLVLVGVGYRVANNGQILDLSLGYTHNIYLQLPQEVKVETKSERNQSPMIILESADKQLLGQICAKIRSFRMPEPYKGKGIKFMGEEIRRKSGKSAAKESNERSKVDMVTKEARRLRIRQSIRNKVSGTSECPRLTVFRSNKQIYAQVIDATTGKTLAAASSLKVIDGGPKKEIAAKVGETIAKNAQEAGVHAVVFDRNGYLYHGRVKELADAARRGGLKF